MQSLLKLQYILIKILKMCEILFHDTIISFEVSEEFLVELGS